MEEGKEAGLGRGQSTVAIQCHQRPQRTLQGGFETGMALQNCPELRQGYQASSLWPRALFSQGQVPDSASGGQHSWQHLEQVEEQVLQSVCTSVYPLHWLHPQTSHKFWE